MASLKCKDIKYTLCLSKFGSYGPRLNQESYIEKNYAVCNCLRNKQLGAVHK